MVTLLQSINKFIDNITPSDLQDNVVQSAYDNLEGHLNNDDCPLHIKEVFLNGSYIRGTMIRPINDIDVFAVIDDTDYYVNGSEPNPQTVLNNFKKYLNGLDDYEDKCRQDRPCITIDLSKLHIDVMPALRHAGALKIPNGELNGWMFTDPKSHNERFSDVDRRRDYKVKDVVKAVKYWKREYDVPVLSFQTEQVACYVFDLLDFSNAEEGIRLWFDNAEGYLGMLMTGSYNDFIKARDAVRKMKARLNDAKESKDQGDSAAAIRIWKELFGRDFPVIDVNEARSFGAAIKDGSLKWTAAAGLSTTVGKALAASGGFYGDNAETEASGE